MHILVTSAIPTGGIVARVPLCWCFTQFLQQFLRILKFRSHERLMFSRLLPAWLLSRLQCLFRSFDPD